MKVVFVLVIEILLLCAVKLIATAFGYLPHTVLVYVASGALTAYVASVFYDRFILKQPTELEVEVKALRQVLTRNYQVSNEEIEAEKLIAERELTRK